MNRSIALFVALVVLLAHVLAIHNDGLGNFAFPYDQGYVVFRLAKNLVREGQLAWNLGMGPFESHPSPLWIAVAAVGERLAYPVYLFCQAAGVLATLFTVILLAQFRPERTASLIAPLLLVTSGCIAAAAASGLETAVFVLFATASFWCLERALSLRLAISLTLLCLTRPEGVVLLLGMLLLRARQRSASPEGTARERALWPFAPPLVVLLLTMVVRSSVTGAMLPPSWLPYVDPAPGQVADGVASLRDFVLVAVSPVLVVYPIVQLARRRLSPTGARALALALTWIAFVTARGRSPLPFAEAFVPALPFLFLAIQEGLTAALDSPALIARRLAIGLLALSIAGSAFASKEPEEVGVLGAGGLHRAWMGSSGSARFGYEQPLGRLGLQEEIRMTNRLRAVGLFLRDHVAPIDPTWRVLSPWPASLAYLSQMHVHDLLGRTNPVPGRTTPASWDRRERADVLEVLRQGDGFDYVVPLLGSQERAPTVDEIASAWLAELDVHPEDPARHALIVEELSRYELVDVPVYGFLRGRLRPKGQSFYLLRHARLGQRPELALSLDDGGLRVEVRHKSHQQLVDLSIVARDERGRRWHLRPTGEPSPTRVRARTSLLLYNTGERAIELYRGPLPAAPDGARIVEVEACLVNPGAAGPEGFSAASEVVRR